MSSGMTLLRSLVEATGLPPQDIESELIGLLRDHQIDPQNVTIEQIREVLGFYLQETLLGLKAPKPSS